MNRAERRRLDKIRRKYGRSGMALKKIENKPLENIFGEPWMLVGEDGKQSQFTTATLARLIVASCRGLKGNDVKFADDEMALLCAESLRTAQNGTIEFEETPHKWLVGLVKDHGAKLLSPNTSLAVKALEHIAAESGKPE